MAFTQAQIDALDAAIAKGALTVKDGENLITYRSVDDMIKARAYMAGQLSPVAGTMRYQLADFRDD